MMFRIVTCPPSPTRAQIEPEMATTSEKVITLEDWRKKLKDANIQEEDLDRLVMNYLVTQGWVESAESFRKETGIEPEIDLATIKDRVAIKKAIECGNVEDAINKVNDLNPEILDTNPLLSFHLQQQRVIELIRNGKTEEALEIAQQELAPRAEENPAFQEELERTVTLLVFNDLSACPFGYLLDISQRRKIASEVNAAILSSENNGEEPKLPCLLKMWMWTLSQLDEKAIYPPIINFSTAKLGEPAA